MILKMCNNCSATETYRICAVCKLHICIICEINHKCIPKIQVVVK